jgi:hypothetical protein
MQLLIENNLEFLVGGAYAVAQRSMGRTRGSSVRELRGTR